MVSRRAWLRNGAVAAAGVLLGGACAAHPLSRVGTAQPRSWRTLTPVRVAADRVIRRIAGLRPFRPAGFVVRAERFGDKLLVHNYGHGGGGISLSWGSSTLAAELAMQSEQRKAAVLGCGVMGLTTARLLQDRGFDVTIYTRDLPPHTTSNIAGGQWSPASVFENGQVTPAFEAQYERAARTAHRYYQNLTGTAYGVRWIENYVLSQSPPRPRTGAIADLYPAGEVLDAAVNPFGAPHVRVFTTMLIEPSIFLNTVTRDFLLRGGRIVIRELHGPGELNTLDEPVVMNCTGLGSRTLFGDEQLTPVKGQLAILLPQPEVDYITLAGDFYMFPRTDGILLGGTHERGEWSTEPTAVAIDRIIEGHRTVFDAMRRPESSLIPEAT